VAEPRDEAELPQAIVAAPRRRRISIVWIIPLLAAVVAIGIAVQRIRSEGPTITIVFRSAEGIEPGKTFIKYKDVNIGQVRAVHLTEDFAQVEITAKITKRAAGLMVEDAKFWVVRPTISLAGISGLNTLLSGNYIGFEPGASGVESYSFTGLDAAPFVAAHQGREFVLKSDDLGSISAGSPIYYRRLPVGQVVSYDLAPDGKSVEIHVFIKAPYDKYVHNGTRFWKASGLDVVIDANGLDIRTESVVSLLVGGLAFDAAPFITDTALAPDDAVFTLYTDRASAMKAPEAIAHRYVLYFDESVRGLAVGAPVTFLGIPAGEVTDISLAYDAVKASVRPRVTVTFYPERVVENANGKDARIPREKLVQDDKRRRAFVERLVAQRGLRAQLRTGSLLTGQLYVAFEYFPRAAKAVVAWNDDAPVLPVAPSSLADIEGKLTALLDKIDKLPLEDLAGSLRKDLDELGATLADARKLIKSADTEIFPTLKSDLEGMQRVIGKLETAIDNVDATLTGPNAPAQQELRDALAEFARAARSIRVLVDYLERHPESPIRGKREVSSGGR
jgi:paraquat-inducible protein B